MEKTVLTVEEMGTIERDVIQALYGKLRRRVKLCGIREPNCHLLRRAVVKTVLVDNHFYSSFLCCRPIGQGLI